MMIMKKKHRQTRWSLQLSSISLYLLFQIGCLTAPPPMPTALHYEAQCPPADVKSHLRQYLTSKGLPTSESTTDGKSFLIATDFIQEPTSGRLEKQVLYKVMIKPAENANTASIDLNYAVQSKGIREKTWQDTSSTGLKPQYQELILQKIPNICSAEQPK